MSLKLYMDQHIHSGITKGLRLRNVDVITAYEDQRSETADPMLLDRASALGRILVSKDKDFFKITAELQRAGKHFSGVVHIDELHISMGVIISDLELICAAYTPEEVANLLIRLPM